MPLADSTPWHSSSFTFPSNAKVTFHGYPALIELPSELPIDPEVITMLYNAIDVLVLSAPRVGTGSCAHLPGTYSQFLEFQVFQEKSCIQNFMNEMELKPGSKNNMLA